MPEPVSSKPKTLKPYLFHGVDLDFRDEDDQATGTCPFCDKEGKFSVNIETGLFRCWSCQTGNEKGGGNALIFIRKLYDICSFDDEHMEALAKNRRLLSLETLKSWGVARSHLTEDYVVPAYWSDGKLCQLYRYILDGVTGKYKLLPTPEMTHGYGLFGFQLFDKKKPHTLICEGPWDGMALWESLRFTKDNGEGEVAFTGSIIASLSQTMNVIATPGCTIFSEKWCEILEGKDVSILFDNDHPRKLHGKEIEPAGFQGVKRIVNLFTKTQEKPKSLSYLAWGESGYDANLTPGFDIRDFLKDGDTEAERAKLVGELFEKIQPIPDQWTPRAKAVKSPDGKEQIECLPCDNWKELIQSWRKPMKWTEGLDRALSVMLASIVSTKLLGDQLWVKVIAPPSSGKSVLCEALSVNSKYVVAKSTIRGFHSGFQTDREGKEDNSLIAVIRDKTLIIKDGDTLLQSPNIGQVLSEARDLYDRVSRSSYRNKMGRDQTGINTTLILAGTNSLRALDTSELGERFVDCVIMEEIDPEFEDEVTWRAVNEANDAMNFEAGDDLESQDSPEMFQAKQLTGGYVAYLRQNARDLSARVQASEAALRKCMRLGQFVAFMRARPSVKQEETSEREFAPRLAKQFTRLAKALAIVLNRDSFDEEVMRRVTRCALDTARGRTFKIAAHLYKAGTDGIHAEALAVYTNEPAESERKLLRFLRRIKAVETFSVKTKGLSSKPRWRLTERMRMLYEGVLGEANSEDFS